eukprot:CAMPEP_0118638828 /NCGR_PEP_ID=MMETSP0785-20121206/3904_1 /TAXON_ID=91992 /ORGANISM="Bolidomonas pacifica, Strain CCMP 1866" /LENGTH=414 /DNA_ID=CAMNT_0006530127 /DNA_START=94 /DNA_END=1335 /DNA_ORIENTATION=-
MLSISSGIVDSLASILGSPPAYTLVPPRPPSLNLRKNPSTPPPSSPSSTPPLHLTQYVPAYGLQLFLRAFSVPHVVLNTDYRRCINSSSSYPLITDTHSGVHYVVPSTILGGGGGGSYAEEAILSCNDESSVPPTTPLGSPLAYLIRHYAPQLLNESDNNILLYTNLISSTLSPLLLALSFADNGEGYDNTRSLFATPLPDLPEPLLTFVALLTRVSDNLSLWAEKVSVVRSLSFPGQYSPSPLPTRARNRLSSFFTASSTLHLDVPTSLRQATNAYRILSEHLAAKPTTPSSPYFFQTPTTLDPVLFEHLYSAMVNPHLCQILCSYPLLLVYFTNLVDNHFFNGERNNEQQTNDLANEDNPRDRLRQVYNFAKKAANSSSFSAQQDSASHKIKLEERKVVKKNRSLLNLHRLR